MKILSDNARPRLVEIAASDDDRVVAPAGTLVFARPCVKRTAVAEEPETRIIAVGGTPGKAYEPHGWELWAPLRPLYERGEYAEVADRGRPLVEAHPEYADLFYNLACCESLAGRTTDAIKPNSTFRSQRHTYKPSSRSRTPAFQGLKRCPGGGLESPP